MRYVTGVDEKGAAIDVRDPLAARLRELADEAGPSPEQLARTLLGVGSIFGDDLAADPRFVEAVTEGLAQLYRVGAKRAVAAEPGAA